MGTKEQWRDVRLVAARVSVHRGNPAITTASDRQNGDCLLTAQK